MTPEEEWDEMMRLSKLLSNAEDVVKRATIDAERARKEFYDFIQKKIDQQKAKATT